MAKNQYILDTNTCISLLKNNYLLIGATAIYDGCIMVTGNTKHFERMPGIVHENWHEN